MPVLNFRSIAEARAALTGAGFTAYVADPAGATPYRAAGLGRGGPRWSSDPRATV